MPRHGYKQTFFLLKSFCLACKLSQHLLEVRLSTDRNINMLHDWTNWRRNRDADGMNRPAHCVYSLVVQLLCTAVLTEVTGPTYCSVSRVDHSHISDRRQIIQRLFLWLLLFHRPPPPQKKPFSTSAMILFFRNTDFSSTFFFNSWEYWHRKHPCIYKSTLSF